MEIPNINWTFAAESLADIETRYIRDFFRETDRHFQLKLSTLLAQAERDGQTSDDDIDSYVDLRDELEGFGQLNRYFALLQAYSLTERIFSRVVESAIDSGILEKSILGGLKFPNTTVVNKSFAALGIKLSSADDAALQKLRNQRHTILHSGGWYQAEKGRKGKLAPVLRLEFTEAEVESALGLTHRCTKSVVSQYRTVLLDRARGHGEPQT